MGYMEDYEDYIELDTISYSIYEETVNEKDAEISKLQSKVEELEEELESYAKKIAFTNQRKVRIKAKEKENAIKQSEIGSKNCIRKQSRSKKR